MRNTLMLVLCSAALLVSGCSTLQPSDSANLQGTWSGEEIGAATEGTSRLTFTGNTLEFRSANEAEWYKGTFTVREDAKPRQIVAEITDCPAPDYIGKTTLSIYQLDGDTLTVTGNEPGNPEVPSSFDAEGARQFVMKKQ